MKNLIILGLAVPMGIKKLMKSLGSKLNFGVWGDFVVICMLRLETVMCLFDVLENRWALLIRLGHLLISAIKLLLLIR